MSSQTLVLPGKLPRTPHKRAGVAGALPVTLDLLSQSITVSPAGSEASDYFDKSYNVFDTPANTDVGEDVFGAGTPLTPPSTTLQRRQKRSTQLSASETPTRGGIKQEKEDIKPRKIFRQLTAMLVGITETNTQLFNSIPMLAEPDLVFKSYTEINKIVKDVQPQTTENHVDQSKATQKPKVSHAHTRNLLEEIIPCDIKERLGEKPTKCIATKVKARERCGYNKKASLAHAVKAANALAETCKNNEIDKLEQKVRVTVMATMCKVHINAALGSTRVDELRKILDLCQSSSSTDPKVAELRSWMSMLAKQNDILKDSTKSEAAFPLKANIEKTEAPTTVILETISLAKVDSSKNASATLISTYSTHVPNFQPYQSRKLKLQSVKQALRDLLQKPLTKPDLKPGHIYIYWYPGLFHKVKIGRSRYPYHRVKEWDRQCKRKHELHVSSYNGELSEVPHVSRIERLMHVELKNVRLSVPKCEGCQKQHVEWFDVSDRVAVRVFEKWKRWMASSPYEEDGSGNWALTPEAVAKLDEICEPVSLLEDDEKPAARQGRKKKTVRRKRTRI